MHILSKKGFMRSLLVFIRWSITSNFSLTLLMKESWETRTSITYENSAEKSFWKSCKDNSLYLSIIKLSRAFGGAGLYP